MGLARASLLLALTSRLTTAAAAALSKPPLLRAVVSDVDGTLFEFARAQKLSAANRAALEQCIAEGVHVCLATGRIPGPWSDALRSEFPALGACVFGNGALLLDARGTVLWSSQLPHSVIEPVLKLTQGGCVSGAGGGRLSVLAATHYDEPGAQHPHRYLELSPDGTDTPITQLIRNAGEPEAVLLRSLNNLMPGRRVLKFVIWTLPGEPGWASMPATVEKLRAALEGTGATLLSHGERWCEVLPPGVNKGTGVERLLSHLAVAPAEALACGDAENDVEMLELAGVGAAMANAQPAALAAADVVVPSNVDDGVAVAVRRYVFGESA